MPEASIPQPFGIVYKATNKMNGKVYVGKTRRPLRERIVAHASDARRGAGHYFAHAIAKYGLRAFAFEIIEPAVNAVTLSARERYWIDALNATAPNGYNLTYGGDGGAPTVPHDLSLVGRTFGMLAIQAPDGYRGRRRFWICRCSCGATKSVQESSFKSGNATTCGCGRARAARDIGTANRRHGLHHSRTYWAWSSMKRKCTAKSGKDWKHYGARGISVVKPWMSFAAFLVDMGECPDGMRLMRVNKAENFEPANCRWGSPKELVAGCARPRGRLLAFRGQTKSMKRWSDELKIPYSRLEARIRYGWTTERALTEARYGGRR